MADPVAHNLAEASHGEGEGLAPAEGLRAVETEAAAGHHPDPSIAGIFDGTVIVSIAMAVFIAILLWKKVPALIVGGLDKQIAAIRSRLDEAGALRAEAEALRDEYARKIATVEQQAAAMLAHAQDEAKSLIADAERDAEELVARRGRMAEDKIAAAERAAVNEIRARAANAAAAAAERLIRERHGAEADKALVDQAIAGLGRPN